MRDESTGRKTRDESRADSDAMLGHEAAAKYIGRTVKTLYGYCHEGRISRVRDGRRNLYRVKDLDALIASLRREIPASVVSKSV